MEAREPNDLVRQRLAELDTLEQIAMREFHRRAAEAAKLASSAVENYERRLQSISRRRQHYTHSAQEPIVLVRRGPGPEAKVFHPEDSLCGWRNPAKSDRMLLSEAKTRGLRLCSSFDCHLALKEARETG